MSGGVRRNVPPSAPLDRDVRDTLPAARAATVEYSVYSFSPGKAGDGVPCTEVHLVLKPVPEIAIALRLKSADALDTLIGVLLAHRRDVWGPK